MEQRCNSLFDCKDESDENDCRLIHMNEHSYTKEMPPFKIGQSVQINCSILLLSIHQQNRVAFNFQCKDEIDFGLERL